MARSRTNGRTGDIIDLYAFFYKNNELAEPSSIGSVDILKYDEDSILASFAGSDLIDCGSGIRRLEFSVPYSYEKGHYVDRWNNVVMASGVASTVTDLEFTIVETQFEVDDSFDMPNYDIVMEGDYGKFKLYEKKWIKFNVVDTKNVLQNTDRISLLLKDYNGSNVYLSSLTVNERMNSYYYFNSSQLQADYPDYIDRDSVYEWVFRVEYRDQVYQPDPVQFKFSET